MSVHDEIIKLAKDGDREAQREIYDLLIERVHRLVGRIVGNSDVDDVTQDIFINVFAKLSSFRHDSKFTTWVHRLAVNDALQHLRRRRYATSVGIESAVTNEKLLSDQMELKEIVDLAFARIDPELRSILELKDGQKLSYLEIADIVGVPIGTVGSRLNRARRELHDQLTALGWEG